MDKSLKNFGDVFKIRGEKALEPFEKSVFVKTLSADKTENRIIATLYSEKIILSSEIDEAEKVIREKYRLNAVKLIPTYPRKLLDEEYFSELDKRIIKEFPSATGHFSGAEWSISDDNIITLRLHSGLNGFFGSCVRFIRDTVSAEFGISVDVNVETPEGGRNYY